MPKEAINVNNDDNQIRPRKRKRKRKRESGKSGSTKAHRVSRAVKLVFVSRVGGASRCSSRTAWVSMVAIVSRNGPGGHARMALANMSLVPSAASCEDAKREREREKERERERERERIRQKSGAQGGTQPIMRTTEQGQAAASRGSNVGDAQRGLQG